MMVMLFVSFLMLEILLLFICLILTIRIVNERRRAEATQRAIFNLLLESSEPARLRRLLDRDEELRRKAAEQNWKAFCAYGLEEGT